MILLVDVGNSRIKWMLWERGRALARGGLFHRGLDREELGRRLWGSLERPARVIVANVAGAEMAAALSAWAAEAWSVRAQFVVSEAEGFGIRNAYAAPERLGVDRWAAMIGARTLTSQACCIVDCGTAITIDALSATGVHLGGAIVPGIRLMREALYRDTRQIPADEVGQVTLFGRSTHDCVWGGTAYAVTAAIDRISERMEEAMGGSVCRLLTGGDVELLRPVLKNRYRWEPDLIFIGLLVVAGQSPAVIEG